VTDDTTLGIALTTVRPEDACGLVAYVLSQESRPGFLSVVHQGPTNASETLERRLLQLAAERHYRGLVFSHGSGRGISRGRNQALRALPESVIWVWTPNDNCRPATDWVRTLGERLEQVDRSVAAVALDFRVEGRLRRQVSDVPELSGWSLWRAIEAALVWRLADVVDLEGFDERIGTGARGWAQSGEGTDLLCRLRDKRLSVVTLDLSIEGRGQHAGSPSRHGLRKEFYYGVGFGVVARRHFALGRSLVAVVSPLVKLVARRPLEGQQPNLPMALTAFAGRGVGLLLGERAVRLRMRGDHWA
jgi:hypothetical protein